jgi:hypothetical protein
MPRFTLLARRATRQPSCISFSPRQFGTNNLPDCSNMCHESSGCALLNVIGVGKGTVSLEDFEKADAIFVIGQNPGTNHPRMLTACKRPSNAVARSPASMCFPRWASCDSPIPRISPPKRIGAIPVFPRLWPPTWAKPSQHAGIADRRGSSHLAPLHSFQFRSRPVGYTQ